MFAAALVLAAATIVWPEEQSYGPYLRPDDGRHALAVARSGVLLAWSEREKPFAPARIRVALLSRGAQLISPISILPVSRESADGIRPAVASDGTNFFVAFIEDDAPRRQTFGVVVHGATGLPVGAPVPYGERSSASNLTVPLLFDGAAYRLRTADAQTLALAPDGTVLGATTMPSAVAADGTAITLGLRTMLICTMPGGGPFRCSRFETRYEITWTGAQSGSHVTGFSPPLLAVAPAGNQFAIAWGGSVIGYVLTGGGSQIVASDNNLTETPSIDCDGQRCVLAYGTGRGDVHAIVFAPVRGAIPELLRIATSPRTEHNPVVRSLGGGRFLVTYESDEVLDRRLAGRIVTFEIPKTRAVR